MKFKKYVSTMIMGIMMAGFMVGCSPAEKEEEPTQETCVKCGKVDDVENMWGTEDGAECEECVHSCPNCNKQMEELQADNWYCTNPECVSYTDPNESEEELSFDLGELTVYVNMDTGKYHQDADSHRMKSSTPMTINEAHEKGYSACGNCYR